MCFPWDDFAHSYFSGVVQTGDPRPQFLRKVIQNLRVFAGQSRFKRKALTARPAWGRGDVRVVTSPLKKGMTQTSDDLGLDKTFGLFCKLL